MRSPFDIRVSAGRLPSLLNDPAVLLPGFMESLKVVYINEILEQLRKRTMSRQSKVEYEARLRLALESLGLPKIATVTEDLLSRSMTISYRRPYYILGFSSRSLLPEGSRVTVDRYLRLIEFGTKDVRPLSFIVRARRIVESRLPALWLDYYHEGE